AYPNVSNTCRVRLVLVRRAPAFAPLHRFINCLLAEASDRTERIERKHNENHHRNTHRTHSRSVSAPGAIRPGLRQAKRLPLARHTMGRRATVDELGGRGMSRKRDGIPPSLFHPGEGSSLRAACCPRETH